MATTLEIQQTLVADAGLFSLLFNDEAGKKWFVKKIVAHHSAAADVEAASRQSLTKAKAAADALVKSREEKPAYVSPGTPDTLIDGLFARIAYAALAVHPVVFLDGDNAKLLEFVVTRRVRTIFRMSQYVNSGNNYFGFPPEDVWHSSVRSFAEEYWASVQETNAWPFGLSAVGKQDPQLAINKLFNFQVPADRADRNRVECQTAATLVLMESLLAAADAPKLLQSLASQSTVGYLGIDFPDGAMRRYADGNGGFNEVGKLHVLAERVEPGVAVILVVPPIQDEPTDLTLLTSDGRAGDITVVERTPPTGAGRIKTKAGALKPTELTLSEAVTEAIERGTRVMWPGSPIHFLSDTRPAFALFEQGFVPLDDLQPGDVVHVLGHPLLRDKVRDSAFGGERCVVIHPWTSRPYMMVVTGHGIGVDTLLVLTSDMLHVVNRLLSVARRVLSRCLNPALNANPVASGTIPLAAGSDAAALAREAWIKEAIGSALNLKRSVWDTPNFFNGTWKAHNFLSIDAATLPWWDQLADFGANYPRNWALEIQGEILVDGNTTTFAPNTARQLFIFDYWSEEPDDDEEQPDLRWPDTADSPVPENGSRNFVAIESDPTINSGGTDPKRHFGIPHLDDQMGVLVMMPLFLPGALNVPPNPTILTYDDMQPQLFAFAKDDTEAWVLRPRVSDDADYLNYLKTIGALPSTP